MLCTFVSKKTLNVQYFASHNEIENKTALIFLYLGAVLNRFSKDMNQVDEMLPLVLLDVFFVSFVNTPHTPMLLKLSQFEK